MVFDEGSRMFWVEGVLHLDGDILHTDGVYRRRIDDLGTEVTQLHSLNIRELVDGVGRLDNLRVGCHESVHIGPNLQHLCIQSSCNDSCCVVTSATSQVGGLVAVAVTGYEAGNNGNGSVGSGITAADRSECFLHQFCSKLGVQGMLAVLLLGADEVTAVHAQTVLDQSCHYVRRQALAIADDGILCLAAQVMNQVDAIIDALQLVEQRVYSFEQVFTFLRVGDNRVYHLVVAFHNVVELIPIAFITLEGHLGRGNQFVGDAVQRAYYYYDRLRPSLCLHDFLQAKNAFCGTYGRSAEFHYFHISMQFIFPKVPFNNGASSYGAAKIL